jgi:predicted transcriptional regulator
LETLVLRLVWETQPCTEKQVTERVQRDRPVTRTTVLKTIQRLEGKGLLARAPGTGPVQYRATQPEGKVLPALVRRFVEGMLGGSPGPLVAYLADTKRLTQRDLEALRRIADKLAESE